MGLGRLTIAIAISIASIIALASIGRPLWDRTADLSRHLHSGGWTVKSGRDSLYSYLVQSYAQPVQINHIILFGGSGQAYPLDDDNRPETIAELGGSLFQSTASLRSSNENLISFYSRVVAATRDAKDVSRSVWQDAYKKLSAYNLDLGPGFEAAPVNTDPGFDSLDGWEGKAVMLPQSSRCRGTASGLHTPQDEIATDISIRPRFVDPAFSRPWYSPGLVAEARKSKDPAVQALMASSSAQSIIADRLAVVMPDGVLLNGIGSGEAARLASVANAGDCCRISCLGQTFALRPGAHPTGDAAVFGLRYSPAATAFAVVGHSVGGGEP